MGRPRLLWEKSVRKPMKILGGVRIAIENPLGSPFTLKYAIASSGIDDELSGESQLTDLAEIDAL